MPKRCVAAGCSNTSANGVSLHKFPLDPKFSRIWAKKVRVTRAKWQGPSMHSVLCSAHFTPGDLDDGLYQQFGISRRRQLKPDAIPTQFVRRSSVKSPVEKKSRQSYGGREKRRVLNELPHPVQVTPDIQATDSSSGDGEDMDQGCSTLCSNEMSPSVTSDLSIRCQTTPDLSDVATQVNAATGIKPTNVSNMESSPSFSLPTDDGACVAAEKRPTLLTPDVQHTDVPAADMQSTSSSSPAHRKETEIGPYITEAGLAASHFTKDFQHQLPILPVIKCGLVLELMSLLTGRPFKLSVTAVAGILKTLRGKVDVCTKSVVACIRFVQQKEKKIRRNEKKGKTQEQSLLNLWQSEFLLVKKRTTQMKEPDTPRTTRLRQALDEEIVHSKSVVKKLRASELQVSTLKEKLSAKEDVMAQMKEEIEANRKQIQELRHTVDDVKKRKRKKQEGHQRFKVVSLCFDRCSTSVT